MNSSDSEENQSQSEFNLNKLNPDDSQPSQSYSQPNQIQQPQHQSVNKSGVQSISENTKTMPQPFPSIKSDIVPKKQLTLVKQNKPRLIIDHMILKNFKSYAGVQKIGPFHKNFTSIVGPNGSGKSNLIQSIASWMRLKNLHQLIHNSSAATNVSSAAVQVHFKKILDNNDGSTTQLPGSQFFIRRTVNTSSQSKYYLNGQDSTQLEIKTKLKSQGIDLTNNRFLILQGEVEQISQMKQKSGDRDKPGFLEYLEDIIGSNIFIERIDQAVKQYNQSEQSRHQKGQRMKIIQQEVKGMSSQKQQAIRYVKKQRRMFQIQTVLQQVIRSNCNYELKKGQQKINQLQQKKDQIIKQQKQKMIKQAERVSQIKKIRAQEQKCEKEIIRDAQKISQLSAQDKNYRNQIAYNSQDQVKYQKKIQDLNQQFNKIIEQSDQIKKNLPSRQKKLLQQKNQLQQLKAQLAKYDKPQLRQKIKNFQNQIKKCNHTKNTINDKKKFLISEVQKIQQNKGGHQNKKEQFVKLLQQNMQTKAKIQLAIQVAQKQYKRTKQQYQVEIREKNRLKHQLDSNQVLMREKSSQRMEQGQFNNMFNHIMKANIPGVVGRLGDLGDINKQYDQVITTACSRLDNIVTETFQAAQAVLKLLKQNRLGRATCIILDKISDFKNYMSRPFQSPVGSVRLFDLIKPVNQQARVAFYFAISNTLYCQNIDQAMKISLGDENNRRRVIARKNQRGYAIYQMNGVINTVSARRGGFQKKVMKKPNQNQDRQILRRIQELNSLVENKNQICRNIQKTLKQQQNALQLMKAQTFVAEGKVRDVTQQLRDIEKMMQRNKGKMQQQEKMKREIKAIEHELQKMQGQVQRLQRGLQAVQNEQKKYQTPQTTAKRQKYKSLRQQFSKLQKQVQRQQVLISTVQKRIKQNQSKKQATQKSIQKLQTMIQKAQNDIKKVQDIGFELSKNMALNKEKKQKLKQKQQEIKKVLDSDQSGVMESKRKIQQAKSMVENAKKQIRKAEQDSKFANSQLQRIRKLYSQMTSTYDFMNDIDQIEQMNVDPAAGLNNSILDVTIHNTSLDTTHLQIPSTTNRKSRGMNQQNRILDLSRLQRVNPAVDLTQDQLDAFLLFQAKLRNSLRSQSQALKKMQSKNLQVISEYKKKFVEYKARVKQFQQVKLRQAYLKKLINQLKDQRFQMFREGFSIINSKLKQVYQLLTSGGDAELELIDSLDPFSDGVNFSVRPPKKAWKQINKLSGGQKTLSSLSLIFALHYYKPTPLYFMDEIDAALDFKNVSIVGEYIKKRTKDAQFIIISLRNNMFDLADKLVGVYKTFDQTKVINLAAAKLLAKKQLTHEQENKDKQNDNQNIPHMSEV